MMAFYSIASISVEAETLPRCFQPFLVQESEYSDRIDLSIRQAAEPHTTSNLRKATELSNMIIWKEERFGKVDRWTFESKHGFGSISIDTNYSFAEFYCPDFIRRFGPIEIFKPFFQLIIQCKLIQNGYTVFHAACVGKDGKAYAFTGPSGIGKSSRAGKWHECLSAEWISGDRPVLDGSRAIVYGAPWDGNEGIYRSVSYPLAAILKIKRSESTSLNEMSEKEKLQFLSEQTFFPLWDTALAAKAMYSLRLLTKNVPVLELCSDITDESTCQAYEIIIDTLNSMKGEN